MQKKSILISSQSSSANQTLSADQSSKTTPASLAQQGYTKKRGCGCKKSHS
ncbi:hypothetical protein PDN54_29885 [Bacillus cereus group sp. Bc252]|uniref:hypothetical protein n=1 Tax=Bacillus cereus group sp. Bc252 TaxID=3018104 RepID=UPI0022E3ACEA|nr:hypothetical protein [Bacillus cereus group sp. Bc252]MDA2164333.1 hypothetical protein [Bacillus cereus group sp. Bc252]